MSGQVGMPAGLYLQQFGSLVESVFEATPYHVGSSLTSKEFRDVDVRVLLNEKQWKQWGFGDPEHNHITNAKWIALCAAFSELGRKMTGLPVDFQLYPIGYANKKWGDKPRGALGMVPWRISEEWGRSEK